jgi:plasmid stability protein
MAVLTVRNVDDETLAWLRARAAAHARSLNAELLDILAVARADELAEGAPRNPFARSLRHARSIGVRTPSTSARIVREDRDRDPRRRRR